MKRADIKTGFLCNNNCRFCVQGHKKKFGNRSFNNVVKDMRKARKNCDEIVLTGGEVTVRPDFLDLVREAKKLGFKTIQIQTNARMFAYRKFCIDAVKAGANEFSPALHGHIPELHDFLTQSKSFKQTVQAIKNLKELKQKVITNTVVVKPNYRYLPEIAKLLVKLNVNQFQFAFVHPMGTAFENFDSIVPWISLAAPYIHKGLQIGIDAGINVMAEAMPFCLMKGYEKYISENYIPLTEIHDIDSFTENFTKVRKESGKMKFPQCRQCKYNKVCEGPWREYPEKRGNKEFRSVH